MNWGTVKSFTGQSRLPQRLVFGNLRAHKHSDSAGEDLASLPADQNSAADDVKPFVSPKTPSSLHPSALHAINRCPPSMYQSNTDVVQPTAGEALLAASQPAFWKGQFLDVDILFNGFFSPWNMLQVKCVAYQVLPGMPASGSRIQKLSSMLCTANGYCCSMAFVCKLGTTAFVYVLGTTANGTLTRATTGFVCNNTCMQTSAGDQDSDERRQTFLYRGVKVLVQVSPHGVTWRPVKRAGRHCCCASTAKCQVTLPFDLILSAKVEPIRYSAIPAS